MNTKYILVALAFASFAETFAQTPVRVAHATRKSLQERHAVTGTLRAVARGDVAALEPGRLLELNVREGDIVKKGQIVARVDARRLEVQKAQAEADRRVAEAELQRFEAVARRAANDLARGERLISQNAVSRQELDGYRAAADIATAEIVAAKRRIERTTQTIRLLDVQLSDTTIHAPYDASVVARHLEPGDWVTAGDKLLTLVSTGPIEAWLEVPERYSGALKENGHSVAIRSQAAELELRVLDTARVNDVNTRVRTMNFVVTVENRDGSLSPGMSVVGWIPAGARREYTTVPKDAVTRHGGQTYVYAIDSQDDRQIAVRIPVRVEFETRDSVAVRAPGLQKGVSVIVEGNERIQPNAVVRVIDESTTHVVLTQK